MLNRIINLRGFGDGPGTNNNQKMKNTHSRRRFIRQSLCGGAVLLGAGLLAGGCGGGGRDPQEKAAGKDPCDLSGLSQKDLAARKRLGYEETSPLPDRRCGNCNLWLPPAGEEKCGGCTLFKGPVYSTAYCTYWAPQA